MLKFNGYEETRINQSYEKIEVGPHICKILEANVKSFKTKDGRDFEKLSLKIDMDSDDKQPNYYSERYRKEIDANPLTAKWRGYYEVTVPNDNSEDFIKVNFKTLITSIEKSNPGYVWKWEEKTLVGKKFCGVFGIEEFENNMGEIIAFTKCRFVRSLENMDKVGIPKVLLANKTKMDYEDYIEIKNEKRKNDAIKTAESNFDTSTIDDDDLPF